MAASFGGLSQSGSVTGHESAGDAKFVQPARIQIKMNIPGKPARRIRVISSIDTPLAAVRFLSLT